MKIKSLFRLCIACFLCAGILLTGAACAPEKTTLTLTRESGDVLVCRESGVRYRRLPDCWLPGGFLPTVYATCTEPSGVTSSFYALGREGANTASYLVCADAQDHFPYYLIAAEGYEMPSPAAFGAERLYVCSTENEKFWQDVIGTVTDGTVLTEIADALTSGEKVALPTGVPDETYYVELVSGAREYAYYAVCDIYGDNAYLYENIPFTTHGVVVSASFFPREVPA